MFSHSREMVSFTSCMRARNDILFHLFVSTFSPFSPPSSAKRLRLVPKQCNLTRIKSGIVMRSRPGKHRRVLFAEGFSWREKRTDPSVGSFYMLKIFRIPVEQVSIGMFQSKKPV